MHAVRTLLEQCAGFAFFIKDSSVQSITKRSQPLPNCCHMKATQHPCRRVSILLTKPKVHSAYRTNDSQPYASPSPTQQNHAAISNENLHQPRAASSSSALLTVNAPPSSRFISLTYREFRDSRSRVLRSGDLQQRRECPRLLVTVS